MKRCPECMVFFEDNLDVCPTCGERLESWNNTDQPNSRKEPIHLHNDHGTAEENSSTNPYVFETASGNSIIINGAVAEVSTQQYYQSKFTKFFQALVSGEPYQLSHTSFVTIFRVEEHTSVGYPEQARDITLYGNVQNIFAAGDDVTVTARRTGNRLVARNVYNHSIDSDVRVQPNIPAGVIRFFAMLMLVAVIIVLHALFTADYAAMGNVIVALISSALPVIITLWILWYLVKSFFKK